MKSNGNVSSNVIWRLMERFGAQGVTLIVSIVLARLLDPSVYGEIAIVTVFITISEVFVDGGIGAALIQKTEADNLDFSTAFYFNIVWSVFLYVVLFFAAQPIASFYNDPNLAGIIRVLGIELIIISVKNIEHAVVSKRLIFKKFFYSTLIGTILAAIVGIYMAFKGFGVWALVTQKLVNSAFDTVVLWFTVRWRPQFIFSISRLKGLLKYSWKIFVSKLIDTVWNDIRQLIIGKKYTSSDLAFYNRGKQIPSMLTNSINSSIDSVLFPVMSNMQHNKDDLKKFARRAISLSSFIIWPMMVGMGVCAQQLIVVLLTEKWLEAVPYLQICCIVYLMYPMFTTNLNIIKSLGYSNIVLKIEIMKKSVDAVLLIISSFISVKAIAISTILGMVFSVVLHAFYSGKLIGYGVAEQIKDSLPYAGLSLIMGLIVLLMDYLLGPGILTLCAEIIVGAIVYFLLSYYFKLESFAYYKSMITKMIKRIRA